MSEHVKYNRRKFLSTAAMTVAATKLAFAGLYFANSNDFNLANNASISVNPNNTFNTIKQVNAGELNIGYVEAGSEKNPAVILLHGWPYDIHSFADVAPAAMAISISAIALVYAPLSM
jgi:hypothetical protein